MSDEEAGKFDPAVRSAEYNEIKQRRTNFGLDIKPPDKASSTEKAEAKKVPYDLFGVSLSGGGIRSASFCLGALQALDQYKLIERMDYLSTVSGGGYIGASMVAAMSAGKDTNPPGEKPRAVFPFTNGSDGEDVRDSIAVGHLRDHSRFLAPKGFKDILLSVAVVMRGLMVNFLLLLAVLLPLATVIVATNPTAAHLDRSMWLDIAKWLNPSWEAGPGQSWYGPIVADPLVMTKLMAALLATTLVAWALWRSFDESFPKEVGGLRRGSTTLEHASGWTIVVARYLLIGLLIVLAVEMQPRIVAALIAFTQADAAGQGMSGIKAVFVSATAIIAATATFRGTLIAWIEKALNSSKIGAQVQAFIAKTAFYALGLALPLLIYGLFLTLVICGIRVEPYVNGNDNGYVYAPAFLVANNWWLVLIVACFLLVFLIVRWVFVALVGGYDGPAKLGGALKILWSRRSGKLAVFLTLFLIVLLAAAAIATRAEQGSWLPKANDDELIVLANYVALTIVVIAIGVNFTENANGLHRLYRDRLSVAFRLGHPETGTSLKLHELSATAPYLLVNGTLNVRRPVEPAPGTDEKPAPAADSTAKSGDGDPGQNVKSWKERWNSRHWVSRGSAVAKRTVQKPLPALPRADPAKRGRNAEFFLFSKYFVGSDATGYASSRVIAQENPQLDLAAAVAISGAAVSSSMGRIAIGWLGPTLALLNLRLGFWLRNPRMLLARHDNKQLDNASWEDVLRLYLFAEAAGVLRSDSSRIYITDGGHIDNIGLYQLLKRRCKLIIVVDAEADPGMNFGAFADVQRFARIDEGALISLDWWPVREAALTRSADRSKQVPRDSEKHKQHFAIGRIIYENDPQEGILLYVKATVTGDEPDYVLDYERRFPNFPHESTGDQFFSEEQMEAYRSLGFHAMRVALEERAKDTELATAAEGARKDADDPTVSATVEERAMERARLVKLMKQRLGVKTKSIDKMATQ